MVFFIINYCSPIYGHLCLFVLLQVVSSLLAQQATPSQLSHCYIIDLTEETDWLQTSCDMQFFPLQGSSGFSPHRLVEVMMRAGCPLLMTCTHQGVVQWSAGMFMCLIAELKMGFFL